MSRSMNKRSFGQLRRQAVSRLRQEWTSTPSERIARGIDWYQREYRWVANLAEDTGYNHEQVAAIAAVLSPRTRWDRAKSLTVLAVYGNDITGMALGRSVRKVEMILAGVDPAQVVSGPKVTSFWHNLCGDLDWVTIDTHAFTQASGRDYNDGGAHFLDRWGVYGTYSEAFRTVAREVGLLPAEFQAALWPADEEVMA